MGLDMTLISEVYIPPYAEKARNILYELTKELVPSIDVEVSSLTVELGYWRKANHIHHWFVESTQEGNDVGMRSFVSKDNLKYLSALCTEVLDDHSKAEELLPTLSGFFFGSQEYDDYYFESLEHTIEIIEKASQLPNRHSIYYQASW